MKGNSIFLAFTDTEAVSVQEYLDILDSSEKVKPAEARFVTPTAGEPGFGHFLLKWRNPKCVSSRVE